MGLLLSLPLAATMLWSVGSMAESNDGPGRLVVVGESSHDFGAAFAGDRLEHTFTLKCVGSGPVLFTRAIPSVSATRSPANHVRPYSMGWPAPSTLTATVRNTAAPTASCNCAAMVGVADFAVICVLARV